MFAALKMVMQNCLRFGNAIADQEEIVIRHRVLRQRARYRERSDERW